MVEKKRKKKQRGWWNSGASATTISSNLKDVKEALLGGNPLFLNFVLIFVTLILCLICLKLTFESLFKNYVFEFLICFARAIIACPRDMPIFQEKDEEMENLDGYFIGGVWAPQPWSSRRLWWLFHWRRLSSSTMIVKETELFNHDLQKFVNLSLCLFIDLY